MRTQINKNPNQQEPKLMAKLINSNGNEREPTAMVTQNQVKSGHQLKESQLTDLKLMGTQSNENPN